tara:strand:- start:461 stop:652 length:192 start_codon:yes stop_codon:yes gene_type:complete
MRCDSCEAAVINGVYSHEIGCPDVWKEMLEALQECLWELEHLGWGEAGYTKMARAAIAKANQA